MNKTELETLPELEQKMNLAKRHLFLLFDFATLSPQEIRLNSSTFSWSGHIFEVVQECKQMIEAKMRQFQDSLRLRRERLIEDLESYAQQVNYRNPSIHPFIYIRQLSPYHTNTVKDKLHTYTHTHKQTNKQTNKQEK